MVQNRTVAFKGEANQEDTENSHVAVTSYIRASSFQNSSSYFGNIYESPNPQRA